jgi:hypothetical protein
MGAMSRDGDLEMTPGTERSMHTKNKDADAQPLERRHTHSATQDAGAVDVLCNVRRMGVTVHGGMSCGCPRHGAGR